MQIVLIAMFAFFLWYRVAIISSKGLENNTDNSGFFPLMEPFESHQSRNKVAQNVKRKEKNS